MALSSLQYSSNYISVEDYLKYEETSETKNEYADGKILTMSGTSLHHNRIAKNVVLVMESQFEGRACETFIVDIRLRTRETRFRYPDVMALCGQPNTDNLRPPCLLNPQVIVEVLSDSTMLIDLNEKLDEYIQIDTLTDYLLFAQDRMWARHHIKQDSATWLTRTYTKPQDTIRIEAIDVALTLADVYRKVNFAVEAKATEDDGNAAPDAVRDAAPLF